MECVALPINTTKNHVFFYEKLLVRVEDSFPFESVTIPKVPRKVCFFTWLVTRGVILTAENLRK